MVQHGQCLGGRFGVTVPTWWGRGRSILPSIPRRSASRSPVAWADFLAPLLQPVAGGSPPLSGRRLQRNRSKPLMPALPGNTVASKAAVATRK